jgi:23S rRNA-/tRNA-specific pseudouridylate synthase
MLPCGEVLAQSFQKRYVAIVIVSKNHRKFIELPPAIDPTKRAGKNLKDEPTAEPPAKPA